MQPITIASTRIYSAWDIEILIGGAIALAVCAWMALARLKHRRH
jgi:hypothetical protein